MCIIYCVRKQHEENNEFKNYKKKCKKRNKYDDECKMCVSNVAYFYLFRYYD